MRANKIISAILKIMFLNFIDIVINFIGSKNTNNKYVITIL